jgi:hypothetical protein
VGHPRSTIPPKAELGWGTRTRDDAENARHGAPAFGKAFRTKRLDS